MIKAFLKSGTLTEAGDSDATETGTPQGGILSPLLANIALSVLDDQFTAAWAAMGDSSARHRRCRRGQATYRVVRYADDFVVLVHGSKAHADQLRDEAAAVLAPMGLRLSGEKTRTCHIDEGFDFLGFRIQRQPKRGSGKPTVYTWPTKKALCTVKAKVRTATRQGLHQPLAALLYRLPRQKLFMDVVPRLRVGEVAGRQDEAARGLGRHPWSQHDRVRGAYRPSGPNGSGLRGRPRELLQAAAEASADLQAPRGPCAVE